MGRIVVTEFVTLDGVIEDPGGAERTAIGGWAFKFDRGEEGNRFKYDELMASDAMLLGRITYQGFAAAWPKMNEDEFGRRMNGMPKYVVSSTLPEASWQNSTVLRGDPAEEVAKLKERHAQVLVAGSARLVQLLAERDLVDEYRLMVYPLIVGAGKRLFAQPGAHTSLSLIDARPAADTVLLTYGRGGA